MVGFPGFGWLWTVPDLIKVFLWKKKPLHQGLTWWRRGACENTSAWPVWLPVAKSCHGYGMDGSCHGEHFDGSISSQGPMALWTGPSMLPVLRAAFLGINFGYFGPMAALLLRWTHRLLSGRFYPWDGTLIQQKWRPPSKFHPVFIDGRSNLWSRGCFKASQGKFTANQSSYSQTNINQNKSISKVPPPPHTHTDMYAMHIITHTSYIYIYMYNTYIIFTHAYIIHTSISIIYIYYLYLYLYRL